MEELVTTYTYLLGVLICFPLWFFCFWYRRDLRKEIVVVSTFGAVVGFLLEWLLWTRDWWQPITLTHTRAGIEDMFLGWIVGGIAATGFEIVFRYRLTHKASLHFYDLWGTLLISAGMCFMAFFFLGWHSFYASLIGMLFPTLLIWYKRRDLIWESFSAGTIVMICSIPLYLFLFRANPDFGASLWQWHRLSNIVFLEIPIEDLLWFFAAGAFLSPLYEYWYHCGLRKNILKK